MPFCDVSGRLGCDCSDKIRKAEFVACGVSNAEQGSLVFLPQPWEKSLEILTHEMRLLDECFGELTWKKRPESEGRGSDGCCHDSDRTLGMPDKEWIEQVFWRKNQSYNGPSCPVNVFVALSNQPHSPRN